jgi:hypothetical protein
VDKGAFFLDRKTEKLVLLGIYLPILKDVCEKKVTSNVYAQVMTLIMTDLKLTKMALHKEKITIQSLKQSPELFQEYIITINGKSELKSFLKPHMKNVIRTLLRIYFSTNASIIKQLKVNQL